MTVPRSARQKAAKCTGFTLIEVLVALGMVAVALAAGVRATYALTNNVSRQSGVLLAHLCADNEIIKIRLSRQMPNVGDSTVACEQAGRTVQRSVSVLPTLKPLYTSRIDIAAPLDLGKGPRGHRRIINILGGAFSGPRLSGRVLPGGADWQVLRSDGVVEVSARYTLETDDGALIYISNRGLRHADDQSRRAAAVADRHRKVGRECAACAARHWRFDQRHHSSHGNCRAARNQDIP